MNNITYAAPKTVAEAASLLSDKGDRARILAGGTDIIVQVREGRRDIDALVDIKHVAEVNELDLVEKGGYFGLLIGAAVPCCLIYENQPIAAAFPGLIDAVSLIGGIQIQSRATLGGNLCNASPAADGIPVLIAMSARCEIAGPRGIREVPIEEFCIGPGKTVLQRGEFLLRIYVKAPTKHSGAAYLRFIPRNEMDIAVVGVGVAVQMDGSKCKAARIALAAVAPTPLLVADAGAVLVGTTLDEVAIAKAAALAQAAAKPISDMRGDADYRRHLVGVLVKRALAIAIDRAKS